MEGDAKIAKTQVGAMNETPNAFMQKFLENEEKAKERKKAEAFAKNPKLKAFLEANPGINF